MKPFTKSLFIYITFLIVSVPALQAEKSKYIPASEVKVSTPVYTDLNKDFKPTLGEFKYRVAWQGIGAAYVNLFVDQVDETLRITAKVRTNSFIDIFYKLRYHATGHISANNYMPISTLIDQRENSTVKQAKIDFLSEDKIHTVRWKNGKEEVVEDFDPNNFTLDPFSAGFLALSLNWQLNQTRTFDTYLGKSRYLVTLKAEELTTIRHNGEDRKVFVVSPKVKKLTATKPKQKLRRAKIYVTADGNREILKIKSDVFIGSVSTKLISVTHTKMPEQRARIAKAHLKIIPKS